MDVRDKVIVVTGAGGGIGAALCRRFAAAGARGIVVADRDESRATAVAREIGGLAVRTDVGVEADIQQLVHEATANLGPIDLFCSNAGIMVMGDSTTPDADWQRIWQVNVMSHVYAARAVLPGMIARGSGYLLQTASAAGLLTQIGSAPYSVTKHAAVGYAEWLSITHAAQGIKVSCVCSQAVFTEMLGDSTGGISEFLRGSALTAEEVAEAVIQGLADERFLILPHPIVAVYFQHKAENYERWLGGMRKLQARYGDRP
jgi:NAD(P)-dependent dehydrogenase (short-subunit alcohol dehydrogenase family)